MKKIKLIIFVLILIIPITIVVLFNIVLFKVGIDIRVSNQTDNEISGLYVSYDEIKSEVKIPTLKPKENYILEVSDSKNSNENFDEAALLLEYKDKSGKLHREYIVGYIERGYSGFANIKITDKDENGKLKVEIMDLAF
ncbi:hypothetical protein [Metabacillus schmidteae]|uniref:hypothetical protein n=1 Tax=Metabacillus schmidteae TaxID=2730405 RepID=UPI00158B2753|nr:hypothetical protein [Metabacillus schmidteae]